MSIFSKFLEERLHFQGDFLELHMRLSNLDRLLNAPNLSCSKPGLGPGVCFSAAFSFKEQEGKAWKKDKQEHMIHSFFAEHTAFQLRSCAFL